MTNSPFSNEAIKERLFDRRNVEVLEHLIEQERTRFVNIDVYEHELDYGPIPTLKEVRNQIFPEVKIEVDEVLEFDGKQFVNIEFEDVLRKISRNLFGLGDAYYNVEKKTIYLRETPIKKLLSALIHEYAHFADDMSFGIDEVRGRGSMFCEGIACGVERKVVDKLALKREDDLLRRDIFCRELYFKRAAYTVLCTYLGVNPKEEIAYSKTFIIDKGFFKRVVCHSLYHALGAVFLSLSELKHGPSVYARALRRDESILQLH